MDEVGDFFNAILSKMVVLGASVGFVLLRQVKRSYLGARISKVELTNLLAIICQVTVDSSEKVAVVVFPFQLKGSAVRDKEH